MNIVSVSWSDHLSFGERDGRLDTPERVERRMRAWREELGAGALHWRILRTRIPGRFYAGRGYRHPSLTAAERITWDDFERVPALAHAAGLEPWLYVSVFDEGWPLAPARERAKSHHNPMHGQHVAWQSDMTRTHPEWIVVDRSGRRRQRGVVSLAYPEARRAFIERWARLIAPTRFDGLFVCLRSQSKPAVHGDAFGFNERVRDDLRARDGIDIVQDDDFDRQRWRDRLGQYITLLLEELRDALARDGRRLGVGAPRGDVLGPPFGNTTLWWRDWVRRGIIDDLVVDQNSSRCPSMWHELWRMHQGGRYLPSRDGRAVPPLEEQLRTDYGPEVAARNTRLFVARQWCERDDEAERALLDIPGVTGLVYSSFRYDNPAPVQRDDWQAGRIR